MEETGFDPPFVNVGFNVADVRLLYNAVDFYLVNRPASGSRPSYQQAITPWITSQYQDGTSTSNLFIRRARRGE